MSWTIATLLFFWDYDTQWGADRSRSPGEPGQWGGLEFVHTDRLLELHAQYDIPACFAVVGAAALAGRRPYHDPEQIGRIHSAGHEIASHSHYHEWLPALNCPALLETLRNSKDALEQCIQAPVVSFVPPYNQPFDYVPGWSLSLSERREAGRDRTDLGRLCRALKETGYRFCRVSYRPLHLRLVDGVLRHRLDQPRRLKWIEGITCVRLHACGFADDALRMLRRAVTRGGFISISGHPHSLHGDSLQNERFLVPFLQEIASLRQQGRLHVALPRDVAFAKEWLASQRIP